MGSASDQSRTNFFCKQPSFHAVGRCWLGSPHHSTPSSGQHVCTRTLPPCEHTYHTHTVIGDSTDNNVLVERTRRDLDGEAEYGNSIVDCILHVRLAKIWFRTHSV